MDLPRLSLTPIGTIRANAETQDIHLQLESQYRAGLMGLEAFSHALLFWWSGGDALQGNPEQLISHPPYPQAGEQGCFATRSPRRPNPIAMTVVSIQAVDQDAGIVRIGSVDARDGSWLLDIKPYIPANERINQARTADWMAGFPQAWEEPRPAK